MNDDLTIEEIMIEYINYLQDVCHLPEDEIAKAVLAYPKMYPDFIIYLVRRSKQYE